MSVSDALKTNLHKVRYTNYFNSDIVVGTGDITIANPGYDCVARNDSQGNNIVTGTKPNPYGKRCLLRYIWNVDGGNYNAAEDYLMFSFTVTTPGPTITLYNMKAAVEAYCDASTLTFRTANGDHGNASMDMFGNYTSGSPSAHSFTIKYVLIALE